MSLMVWLPLNGDLTNQGLSNVTVTNNGATVDNNGKIGKCYSFGSSKRITVSQPANLSTTAASLSCWVNLSAWGSSYDSLVNLSTGTGWNDTRLAFVRNNTANRIGFCIANGSTYNITVMTSDLPLNTWTHLTGTFDGSTIKIYVNGVLNNSATTTFNAIVYGNAVLNIGSWSNANNYPINGKLNDIRIYNHCLSDKEVKEIAKGLVLHYTFNDTSTQNTVYDSSGYKYDATLIGPEYYEMKPIIKNLLGSPNEFSLSNITNNSGDLTYTPNVLAMANYDLPTPIVGHKYYGRVEQLVPPNTSFADGRFEYFITDAGGTGNVVFTSFSEAMQDNQWHMYSSIQQFTGLYAQSGYYMRSFSVNATNASKRRNHMIIDLTDAFGQGNEPTKEWCDENIPYFTGTLSNLRYPDGGRGSAVLHSIGYPSAKILTTLNPSFITNGTLVVWYKKDSSAMNYNSGNFLMATPANGGAWLCATSGDSPPFNSASSYNHWYVDGIEQSKSNFMDTNWHMYSPTGINLSSWTSLSFHGHGDDSWLYRGYIAEIRLYNIELSANDIKELYETSASIDKNGNLYCREIVEV